MPTKMAKELNCIFLILVGGPSQHDTFDPKPQAPAEIRGPFRAIASRVPGVAMSELLPKTAALADQFSIIRSMHHNAPAVHETGLQLLQTGKVLDAGINHPNLSSTVSLFSARASSLPPQVMLPARIGYMGSVLAKGDSAGLLGREYDAMIVANHKQLRLAFDLSRENTSTAERYGRSEFGKNCLRARRLIEAGVRFVTVNMFQSVFHQPSWDAHGCQPFTTMKALATSVAPSFDSAYSALIDDLRERGLYSNTIVVAAGEFGRTPKINPAGGRDHHTGVWSVLIGGGPIQVGRVIGSSDTVGYEPHDRPVSPAELAATIYQAIGIDPHSSVTDTCGQSHPIVEPGVQAVNELF